MPGAHALRERSPHAFRPGSAALLPRDVQAVADTIEDAFPFKQQLAALSAVARDYVAAQAARANDEGGGTALVAGLFGTGKVVRKAAGAKAKAAKKKKAKAGGGGSSGKSGG